MKILRVFSSIFVLSLVIVSFVSKAEGSEGEEEEKGGAGREEGLRQFRRGRILNSGDMCVSCSCSFIYLFISVNSVFPILFFVNNISSNSINNLGVIITISVSYFR